MKITTKEERESSLKTELLRIVRILKQSYDPERIIVFGSMAEGVFHEWSDIDLLIVKETSKRPIERTIEVAGLIQPKVGIDLFIYTPEEFDYLLKEKSSFILSVVKGGKTVYEKGN